MKLIVGLGNPGPQYELTPHNLGFLTVDRIASDYGIAVKNRHCRAITGRVEIGGDTVLLAKPETFMNLSGDAVRCLLEAHELRPESDLVVVYDELDLPLGTIRIRERGGSAGHNGMKSIFDALGTQEFLRIRLGIAPEKQILNPFSKAQLKVVDQVLDLAEEAVKVIFTEGRGAAMNRFNRKPEEPEEPGEEKPGTKD